MASHLRQHRYIPLLVLSALAFAAGPVHGQAPANSPSAAQARVDAAAALAKDPRFKKLSPKYLSRSRTS
jgi:hypothetical protein